MQKIYKFISTLGYVGYVPYAPGTAGSLLTCAIIFILPEVLPVYYLLLVVVLFVLGLFFSHQYFRLKGINDPPEVVIDEAIGMAIGLFMVPKGIFYYIIAFLLFRVFDIVKPYPINKSQDFSGGFGIIMDDVFAGLITLVIVQVVIRVL